MKYLINYGNSAAAFPCQVLEIADRASSTDLRVLLGLCSACGNADVKKLAQLANCTEDEVRESLSFWRGTGIIEVTDGKKPQGNVTLAYTAESESKTRETSERVEKKKLKSADELPKYTSDELSALLEKRQETAMLINECQNIMGKIFNVREINVLIGLVDYLGLDCEYVMMLLTYCVTIGKNTLHYAEKTAFALYDAGITTGAQLSEELKRRENAAAAEGKIRALFGMGERAFTSKEKKFISAWINDMGYSVEIIEKAYEVTADATGKGSFAYANAVLERWNVAGLRTLDAIEESYKNGDNAEAPGTGSFDTDSFFEAAVRRSLGENA
ncbi:MAG: DnaD domain protein [Clostridia bacterium]|nr:DnaD domain protein [Clostridia bacterium]